MAPPPGPSLGPFLGGEETRLRDLLAFAFAVQAGRIGPDGIEPFRRRAEAALTDNAFRTLHNEAERIRHEAAAEERARIPAGGGFLRAVGANLCALAIFAAAALALAIADPGLPARLAQLAGKG
jgi:hypothetical protein